MAKTMSQQESNEETSHLYRVEEEQTPQCGLNSQEERLIASQPVLAITRMYEWECTRGYSV